MLSDAKVAFRSLRKSRGFTIIAVITLALGIGPTTAIFSVVNTVLLQPLPYENAGQLARIYTEFPRRANGGVRSRVSTTEYFYLQREAQSWQSIGAWMTRGANMVTRGEPMRVNTSFITGGLLRTLGVAPAIGRLVTPEDDEPGAALVAVLSHSLWQRAFDGDRGVLGRDILLNGKTHTVVGVMSEDFVFPIGEGAESDVWVPLQLDPTVPAADHSLSLIGRLKSGVQLQEARPELDLLVARHASETSGHRLDPQEHTVVAYRLIDEVTRDVRPALRMLFGAVCFLLLIACVNVANLMLCRAEARQHEIAIRGALGAGPWRLARQFVTEGVILSLTAAAIGLLLAQGGLLFIKFTGVVGIRQLEGARIDGSVMLFAASISLLTSLVFGLAPLAHVIRRNLHGILKTAATARTSAAGAQGFRQALIVGQLALALVLLTGTALMLRTFWNLLHVDTGFDPKEVMTMSVMLPEAEYNGEPVRDFWARLQERLVTMQGVENAALTSTLPPVAEDFGWGTQIEGFVPGEGGRIPTQNRGNDRIPIIDHYQFVNEGYFDTLKLHLVAGRFFGARDDVQSPRVVIINQTMARAIWGDERAESALGRRVIPAISKDWYTIVGVVADAKNDGLDRRAGTTIYLPYQQVPTSIDFLRFPYIAVRSERAPSSIVNDVRRELRDIDPKLPISKARTMEEVVSATRSRPQFLTELLTLFAVISVGLAAVGAYGVISYSVVQRTKEFGIRMALGAQPRAVLNSVLGQGLLLTAGGVLVGLGGAFALTRFVSGFLFGVAATDLATFAVVTLLLSLVAIASSYVAARPATKVDPLIALRQE